MPKTADKETISQSLSKLESIIEWFDEQSEVHVEEGLKKVREGAALVRDLKARLKVVENEFRELKRDLSDDES